jgi:hypothetical protein
MIGRGWSVLPAGVRGGGAQLDALSGCSRLEVIVISGSKAAVDVGRLRTGKGLWARAAACAFAILLTVGATTALASSPPPPPPPSGGGGGGGSGGSSGGGSTTPPPSHPTKPARDTHAPGRVTNLHAAVKAPHRVTITWANPGASDLSGVVVRRGFAGACPARASDGFAIGGAAVRTSQVDTSVAPGTVYCYAVFAFDHAGNYSRAAVAKHVIDKVAPPPLRPVTNVQAVALNGHIELTWQNPTSLAGVASILVVRGPATACPTGPADGTQIGGAKLRDTQVDATAKPGQTYCYRVFVSNLGGQSQESQTHTQTAPAAPATAHPAGAADPPASSSGGWLTSMIVRMVAAVGAAMLLVMAAATLVARRRTHVSAYVAPREYVPRMALTGVTPATLVIPAVLLVGSAAAIVLVLLNH